MRNPFAPVSRSLALEQRILFDAAGAVAIDQQPTEQPDAAHSAPDQTNTEPTPRQILAVDSRISGAQSLAASAKPNTIVVLVDAAQDGMAAISAALQQAGKVDSIQILGHGNEGQMRLGSSSLSATSADTAKAADWAANLTASADILIYGCRTGAGEAGAQLVEQLAALTGADVAASTDDTGSSSAGGDWLLERQTGQIESSLAISADALASYAGLMADASPTVTLSTASLDSLLGGQFTFTATFTNSTTQPGFAPFIDLILPATGKDGAGAEIDDGVTFVSATYLGQTVTAYTLTFDAAGNATHPLAKDAAGQSVIINAASYGARAGDQLVVLQLPYASVISGQPSIPIVITAQLSDLADTTGSPALTLKARGGFQFGNDSADNPVTDPSLFQSSTVDLLVTPTGLKLTQSLNMPEGETVTGPNYERSLTVTATPPPGQTLTNVDITQSLPGTIRVNSITPGAGGTIQSITLINGSTITDPDQIDLALTKSPFLSSYTVRYASMTAPTDTVVRFYVPDKGADGNEVIDPVTGDDRSITLGQPTATGEWLPLDPRDQTVDPDTGSPVPAVITATGSEATFVAKSLALLKTVTIASNSGSAGLSPGDELQYTLNVDLSDYFSVGRTLFNQGYLVVDDQLGDGQQLVAGSPVLTVYAEGLQYTIPLVATIGTPGVGGTTLTFFIAQSIYDTSALFGGALNGDINFDGDLEGATRAVITYRSTVAQAYTTVYTQSEINEGDSIGNSATVRGTLLSSSISLTGEIEDDSSSAALTVPTHTVATSIVTVNGTTPPANVELKPGDIVTFKLAYDLETGDYENFKLTAYLPLPLFDLTGLPLTQGNGAGQWNYGSGDTNADNVNSVTVGAGNSLVFDFGSYATSDLTGKRVEVQFTLTVGNQPFADSRPLTVLGQSYQETTIAHNNLASSGSVTIASVAEPLLAIKHGVVAVGAGSAGIVSDTTGTWAAAGSSGAPFTGSVTDLLAVDGSVANIDGGDLVRLATAIENTGGLGAFDVATTVTLPSGFSFSGGSLAAANLAIYRGDGTALVLNTDYSVSGATITFLDALGQPTLLPGRVGTANDLSGANVIVITYDVVASATVSASSNLQTSAALNYFSSVNGGPDFTPGVDPQDTADQIVAAPVITKVFANGTLTDDDSSASHTTGANLVIGESMLYDIIVTLPEGVTQNLRVNDLIPAGMMLDTSFNGVGYEIITSSAGSGALASSFAGTVTVGSASAPGGDGADLGLTLSAASATADNAAGNNSFVVRVRLIASNVSGNQVGVTRPNSAQAVYSDPDGDTPNGAAPVDRTVSLSGSQPSISVREPTIVLAQTYVITGSDPSSAVKDDIVTYTFTLTNNSGSNDFSAFDINFFDQLPTLLKFTGGTQSLGLLSVTSAGGATATLSDFELNNGSGILQSKSGANIDIPKGGSITIVVAGQVLDEIGSVADFSNTASVQWTSLDGTVVGERTGVDGLLNGGTLNDYRVEQTATVKSASGATLSHVGGMVDTPVPTPTNAPETVAVGEIIRYRFATRIIPGDSLASNFIVSLPDGLSFIDDGTTTVGLLGNSNSTLKWSDGGDGLGFLASNYFIVGGVTFSSETLLPADPTTSTVTALLNQARINASDPRAVKFTIGNLRNDEVDGNAEVFYIEFNVRVDNIPVVETSDSFAVTGRYYSNTTLLSTTNVVRENIVEPNLNGIQKTITNFDPRPSLATGIATITVDFTNTGDGIAYETRLTDSMTGGSNYTLSQVIIGGTSYLPGSLPAGVTVSTAGGITADFSAVAVGTSIQLIYTVEVPNDVTAPSTDAKLAYSSLPENFQTYLGSSVGVDDAPDGERLYGAQDGAGLGIISGTLWDDTASASVSTTPDGTGLAGQTVTLTWAGADGDLATTTDNRSFNAITDSNGNYRFGSLASGNFRIDVVNPVLNYAFGADTDNATVRIDSDGGTLGSVTISLGEGAIASAGFGYVRENDAPVNTLPADQTTLEDGALLIQGIFIADIDASAGDLSVTLSVKHGTLFLQAIDVTVTAGALDSSTVTISGKSDKLNAALQTLLYTPTANYNGTDTLTVTTNDQGNTGDANGNLMPNELADALQDKDTLRINVTPVNDVPVANPDSVVAQESGGVMNTVGGFPGVINVLKNDTDVDLADKPSIEQLTVTRIGLGAATTTDVGLIGNTTVVGLYGTLKINSKGDTTYEVKNEDPAVQALRVNGNTLVETFTYEMRDIDGSLKPSATITVRIRGTNDTPIGVDDEGAVYEAGGVNNGTPGAAAILPNVLDNDTDVDLNGETKNVTGIRYRRESSTTGVFTGVDAANPGVVAGSYGTLTMNYDGSYSYAVDQTATAVQRMVAGDTLIEYFSYVVTDKLGDTDIAQIRITINGAYDNPLASNDQAAAQTQAIAGGVDVGGVITGGTELGSEANPTGNVIRFQSRPGAIDQAGGNGIDTDVDRTDQPNSNLIVTGIRSGAESGGDTTTAVLGATVIAGSYGTLTINPDGSFTYDVDSRNATVQALGAGATLTDTFTYKLADTAGLTDLAELNIIVKGVNDPPVANDVFATAVEAGGVANSTPGVNPSGDALANDLDPDGDPIAVVAFRTGPESGSGTAGTLGSPLLGTYGSLTLNADGTYTYTVDNANPDVQALRISGQTLSETFTYQIADNAATPETDLGQIIVTIEGRNDTPIGLDDTANAVEAGGLSNAVAGTNPIGNVLTNDTDVDSVTNGETKTVSDLRTGAEGASGTTGTVGVALTGTYGSLTLNADGSYTYVVNNNNPDVQALRTSGNTLTELFTYTVTDTDGASDLAQLTITIQGANDTPLANPDVATAIEAGGIANGTVGTNPTGNVLTNDTDVDAAVNGETKAVSAFANSASLAGTLGSALAGTWGSITLNADGSYTYAVDNNNATVQALRTSSNTLTDTFTYTMRDAAGATSTATLTVTIQGANDTPVGVNDTATAVEAGGLNNGTPGSNGTGNVLTNDTDVDNGDTKTVTIFDGSGSGSGTAGGTALGNFGTLMLNADGSYTYVVDNDNPTVQALRTSADTLTDTFTYTLRDTAGLTTTALLSVTIKGANDAPVADNDTAIAIEAGGVANATLGSNGTGNVLTNDTDIDTNTADSKTVTALRTGTEAGAGTAGSVGLALTGQYGSLTLNADGTYTYVVDDSNAAVQALRLPTDTLAESFTYTMRDAAGLTDIAQLTITIQGANDAPVAVNDTANAVEAGGVSNTTPGSNGTGNVLSNDTDIDSGDTKAVSAVIGIAAGIVGGGTDGSYGTLTLNANGSYSYAIKNSLAAVEALRISGGTLTDSFIYTMQDTAGATATATLTVTISGADDNPIAGNDLAQAQAGKVELGVVTGTPVDGIGNAIIDAPGADTDVDLNETRTVTAIRTGTEVAGAGTNGSIGTALTGQYGTLTIQADGSYRYVVDSLNAAVQALPGNGTYLQDFFTYTVMDQADPSALSDIAQIEIHVFGVNDPPVAQDVTSIAVEKGGVANGTVGIDPNGDAVANDTDPEGFPLTVSAIRTGTEAAGTGTAGTVGTALVGQYGTLTIQANGTYTYEVNNDLAAVEALRTSADKLFDYFTYTETDGGTPLQSDSGQITIEIRGSNDTPVGMNDSGFADEAGGLNNATAGTPATGNVLTNDTDVDSVANGETKRVTAVRTGTEAAGGTAGATGSAFAGAYGSLTLNSDGSYTYVIDNANTAVQALRTTSNTLADNFTYTVIDAGGLTDTAQLTITIRGANDAPVAVNDTATAREAGGSNNSTPGSNGTGNVLTNDADVDAGDSRTVTIFDGSGSGSGIAGGTALGNYGTLTLNADGIYTYVIDNTKPAVQALRTFTDTLDDTFTYTMRDTAGATSSTTLTITLHGANDNPVAVNDTATAVEAGGLNNGTPGSNGTGNVLTNDTDEDTFAYGETKTVSTFANSGNTAGTVGSALIGTYGALTLNANGSYTYVVDDANAAVEALRTTANTLSEAFTYTMRDTAGATAVATLTITIQGANDTPLAIDDSAIGYPEIFGSPGSGRNPTGNLLPNDRDVDAGDSKAVSGIRTGTEVAGGALTAVASGTNSGSGERINGTWGWLNIGADGSYLYEVDFARTASLAPSDIVQDYFTYELKDTGGLTDLAQLTVSIRGKNNPPIAIPNLPVAVEAGGVANGTPGIDPSGDVTANDFDFEGDPLSVDAIRTGPESGSGTAGTIGSELAGTYGWLTQQADGTFTYRLDNTNPLVQALRNSGNTLEDFFTYTVSDIYGVADQATIAVTIQGANDDPVAQNDTGDALESGGMANATPGADAVGNVLANDTDVDAYGESKTVTAIRTGAETGSGAAGSVGSVINGLYGSLTLNADGSYTYVVDNRNPLVEALRISAETLTDTFTYRVSDALGANDVAQFDIIIRGANDTPVARDDSAQVSDARGPAVTSGKVLPNDSDVDAGESRVVSAIRAGAEAGSGSAGQLGQVVQGSYGKLVINPDGSYVYTVDLNNPDVIRAQGLGPVLQDVFTYTVADRAGATDQAQLTITLDMVAPYVGLEEDGGSPYQRYPLGDLTYQLGVDPATFVTEAVREVNLLLNFSASDTGGEKLRLVLPPEISIISPAAGLGLNDDQAVRPLVLQASGQGLNRDTGIGAGSATTRLLDIDHGQLLRPTLRFLEILNRFEKSKVTGREGVVSLSADGQLSNISVFSAELPTANDASAVSEKTKSSAASFSQQLQQLGDKPGKSLPQARPAN